MKKSLFLVVLILTATNTVNATELKFDGTIDPILQKVIRETVGHLSNGDVPLTIARMEHGKIVTIQKSTVRVTSAGPTLLSDRPRFYSRIFFGRDTYYRGTLYDRAIFVTASGPNGLSYLLEMSSDLQVWENGHTTGSGVFLLLIVPDVSGKSLHFFRFKQKVD